MSEFADKVREVVRQIPEGEVMSYGAVAAAAGKPAAARAVGVIMSKNFNPDIPCHRVVRADGCVGGYNRGGARVKSRLLRCEGVTARQYRARGVY